MQKDDIKLRQFIDETTEAADVAVRPNFEYLWKWNVINIEPAMGFQDGGNSSKALDFLLFCNGSSQGKNSGV